MTEDIDKLLARLRNERSIFLIGEEATKQGAVLPVLARLGWDRDNIREVVPEHSVGSGRVDYCLQIEERQKVFIEVKRINEELEKHQDQLLEYAFRHGVKIAILTNGLVWWFYLPLLPGSWDQRKFIAIDIQQQELSTVIGHFTSFLSREAISTDDAVRRAEEMHASREKERQVKITIPKAWRELCEKPDELLVELLADKVESICGHRPDADILAEYLSAALQVRSDVDRPPPIQTPNLSPTRISVAPRQSMQTPRTSSGPYTFRSPTMFRFRGESRAVNSFKEVLLGLCATLRQIHAQDFDRIFTLRGRRREYFSRDYRSMTHPAEIPGTDIYVETCLSANGVMERCNDLLTLFGYAKSDLIVDFRSANT